jgi:hypothetical protein
MKSHILSFLLLPVLLLLTSCDRGSTTSGRGAASSKQLDSFAKRCSLVIPPSARAIHYKSYIGMDGKINVTLEMPAAELGPFFKASKLDADITNTTLSKSLPAKFGDFVPKMPVKFREGQKQLPGDEWLNVLVDQDSPTVVLVHLTWFEV